jgi:hypothetical protein
LKKTFGDGTCDHCARPFVKAAGIQRYCSVPCREKERRERRRRGEKPSTEYTCVDCREEHTRASLKGPIPQRCPFCKALHDSDRVVAARRKRNDRAQGEVFPGQRFGRLTVISEVERRGGHRMYLCECTDRNRIVVRKSELIRRTRSCGCTSGRPITNPEGGYARAHARVRAARGPASSHECEDCSHNADHWSWMGGCKDVHLSVTKSGDPGMPFCYHTEHYHPRCRDCHERYDRLLRATPRHWRD